MNMIQRIADGRTDLVFEYVSQGYPANSKDANGTPLIRWCAYYGDVSAIRFLLAQGEALVSLGSDLGLNEAAFHGHWRLCQFLLENTANVNGTLADTGETPLHAAVSRAQRPAGELVVQVLLAHGAKPHSVTRPSVVTGALMRDAKTRAETPLHRAAAFGTERTIRCLLDAGAKLDAQDMNGDTPLAWASWHQRPDSILGLLCYGQYSIHPDRQLAADHGAGWSAMDAALLGTPHV